MFQFKIGDKVLFVSETPTWVRKMENGCYGLCSLDDAEGVVINGVVYNLPGHSISDGKEVAYDKQESGAYMTEINQAVFDSAEMLLNMQYEQDMNSIGGAV